MKKVLNRIGIWIATILAAIYAVLFVKKMPKQVRHDEEGLKNDDSDEINAKAETKRDEAIARLERADARTIAESYDSVCDAIADGKERFRRRCAGADD